MSEVREILETLDKSLKLDYQLKNSGRSFVGPSAIELGISELDRLKEENLKLKDLVREWYVFQTDENIKLTLREMSLFKDTWLTRAKELVESYEKSEQS